MLGAVVCMYLDATALTATALTAFALTATALTAFAAASDSKPKFFYTPAAVHVALMAMFVLFL
jgi:hypothetical protein